MKKTLMIMLALVLVIAMSVTGTLAYLTSTTETVTNTFTVGKVAITLDEAKVDEYGVKDAEAARVTKNSYKLIPGHNYVKDPIVHVTAGSEECYLFVKVVNEISAIEAGKTIAAQMEEKGWVVVDETKGIYKYNKVVDAREDAVDVPVFDAFTTDGTKSVEGFDGKTITVVAYAVQADGFDTAEDAWAAAKLA